MMRRLGARNRRNGLAREYSLKRIESMVKNQSLHAWAAGTGARVTDWLGPLMLLAISLVVAYGTEGRVMAQPPISVAGLDSERVLLLPSSAPEFRSVTPTRDVRDGLLPYIAAVHNANQ